MKLKKDYLEEVAYDIVEGYLYDGPEYLTFSETLRDQDVEFEDEDVEFLASAAREILARLVGRM